MTPILRTAYAAALYLLLGQAAHAQWQAGIGIGTRAVTHTEYDTSGRRLVRESGWLPGLALQAGYRAGDLAWFAGADGYRGDIDYRGRSQAGVGAASTTATRFTAGRIGATYALAYGMSLLAAVEAERWRRDIQGTGNAAGLQEVYRSRRLMLGASRAWQPPVGQLASDAAAVLAAPERLRVGFSGLLDPTAFATRRGHGVRLGAALRPAAAPSLEVRGQYDWIKTPRSADAPLSYQGQLAGTVAQPEHIRQAFTITLSTLF